MNVSLGQRTLPIIVTYLLELKYVEKITMLHNFGNYYQKYTKIKFINFLICLKLTYFFGMIYVAYNVIIEIKELKI